MLTLTASSSASIDIATSGKVTYRRRPIHNQAAAGAADRTVDYVLRRRTQPLVERLEQDQTFPSSNLMGCGRGVYGNNNPRHFKDKPMDHFKRIYQENAAQYEAMVAREDYLGNLGRALAQIRPLAGLVVVELGAGTGRLTRLLAPAVRHIVACDIAAPMLAVARDRLRAGAWQNWHLCQADNRQLPIVGETADMAIAGWSLGHSVGWYADDWPEEIGQALSEMRRVLRPGGTLILLETLGTGRETPQPPTDGLAAFYRWLAEEQGFNHTWIRTDYRFESLDEADELTRFFFGDELADQIQGAGTTVVPECTGIWWQTI